MVLGYLIASLETVQSRAWPQNVTTISFQVQARAEAVSARYDLPVWLLKIYVRTTTGCSHYQRGSDFILGKT